MGCFSVCCSMSKLTIQAGDKVVLFPLLKTGEAGGCMYLSTTDLFQPFSLPIIGYYNDYGSIENIEKNSNTALLEKFFGMSIEAIVEIITDPRKDLYDCFSSNYKYFFEHPEWLEHDYSLFDLAINLGFVKNEENVLVSSYGKLVQNGKDYKFIINNGFEDHPHKQYIDIISDMSSGYMRNHNLLRIHYMLTNNYVGVKNPHIFELFSELNGMFVLYEVYEAFSKAEEATIIKQTEKIDKAIENYLTMLELYKKCEGLEMDSRHEENWLLYQMEAMHMFRDNKYFLNIYKNEIISQNQDLISFFLDFYQFNMGMYLTNTMYTPMFQGSQCGENEIEFKLHYLCCDILKKRMLKQD